MNSKGGSNLVLLGGIIYIYLQDIVSLTFWVGEFYIIHPPKKTPPTQTTLEECPQRAIYSPIFFESIEVAGIE